MAAASLGNFVFFAGGRRKDGSASHNVDIFDLSRLTKTKMQLTTPRFHLAAVAVPAFQLVVFAGGYDGRVVLGTVDLYNVTSKRWSTVAPLPMPRHSLSAAAAGNYVFFAGGVDSSETPSSRIDILDLRTLRWTSSGSLPSGARANMTAVSIVSAQQPYAIFAGGSVSASTSASRLYSSEIDVLDAWGAAVVPLSNQSQCFSAQPLSSSKCINGTWFVNSSTTIDHQNVTVSADAPVIISGNLTITNRSVITVTGIRNFSAPILSSRGCIRIAENSTLVIDISPTPVSRFTIVNVLDSAATGCKGIDGNFSSIVLTSSSSATDTTALCNVVAEPISSPTQVSVLLSVRESTCRRSTSKDKRKMAIIAGCVLAVMFLLFALMLALYFFVYRRRLYRKLDCCFRITKTKSGTEM